MELSQILNSLNSSSGTTEKVASHSASRSSSLEEALDRALNEPLTKTASARNTQSSPVADLTKIASKLASAEQEALIKEAELYGAAVCDGFMSRMQGYENSGVKVAAFSGADSSYDSEMAKLAMELGYQETKAELEKIASQAYTQGYSEVMNNYQAQPQTNAFSKQASIKLAAAVKTASDKYASLGYRAGMQILASMRG
jgi:hypothetical protein